MTSQPQSNPSMTQELLAGTAAGFAILVVGHPFDLMKVRMQVAPTSSARSVLKRFADVIMSEGVFSLYKGMGAPMLAVPLLNAIVFASFGQARTAILNGSVRDLSPTESASAGAIAGLVNSTVASPIELVKCRLQVQMGGIGLYQGPVDCVRRILATDGVRGIFQGMSATIVREVPCYAAQFYTYENLKQYLAGPEREALGIGEQLLIGGLAGIACWIVSYPQDLVKSILQVSSEGRFQRHRWIPDGGFLNAWKHVVQSEGMIGLWKGFSPCAARAFPANAAGFFAYESVRAQLQS